MKNIVFSPFLAFFILCFSAVGFAAPSGIVVTVNPGAWVERSGQKTPLTIRNPIEKGDILSTDSKGMLQVIFSDNTTISLGADANVAVTDFIFDDANKKPTFSANIASGAVRFVTGKVVQQNRSGFSVMTPHATVGIRGTTFLIEVSAEKVTSIIGLDIDSAFPISVENIKTGAVDMINLSGIAIDATPKGNTIYKVAAGTFSMSSSSVSGSASDSGDSSSSASSLGVSLGASPVAGASSASGGAGTLGSGSLLGGSMTAGGAYGVDPVLTTSLEDIANESINKPGNIGPGGGGGGPVHPGVTAVYSGTLSNLVVNNMGTFSFNVTLNAGSSKITDTELNVVKGYGRGLEAAQPANDVSLVVNGNFTTNLVVTKEPSNPPFGPVDIGNQGVMQGGFSQDHSTVSGTWNVTNNNGADLFPGLLGPGFSGYKKTNL